VWLFFETIISEETSVRLEIQQRLVGKRKTINKAARQSSIHVSEKIVEFNDKLEKNEITLNQCLEEVSALIGIKYDIFRKKQKNKVDSDNEDN
jgi:hypothetical protein